MRVLFYAYRWMWKASSVRGASRAPSTWTNTTPGDVSTVPAWASSTSAPALSSHNNGYEFDSILILLITLVKTLQPTPPGAGRSSEVVERSLMVRWVVGSILHGVDPLSYFSFQPVLHDWCNKGRGVCYPVCGMVHIKEPLLLIDKSSLCGGSGFPFSLSEWSLTKCLTPYSRR